MAPGQFVWEPFGADGIATIRWSAGVTITEDLARETIAQQVLLTSGKCVPVLADIRQLRSMTREARRFYGNATEMFSALALLAGSPATRVTANFFIGLNQPTVPTQMFTDEETALTWLRRYAA
jgi:hypothetical protein